MADNLPTPRPATARTVPGSVTGPSVYADPYRYGYSRTIPPRPAASSSGGVPQTGGSPGGGGNAFTRSAGFVNQHSGEFRSMTNVPNGIPRVLGSRQLLFMFWLVAMVLVASDEWKTFPGKFPRPARFWYASLTYALLFLASQIDAMVPLANALGLGFLMVLGYENVSGNGLSLFGVNLTGATPATTDTTPANNSKVVQTVSGNKPQPGVSLGANVNG